jgi:hypothetical protein
MGQPRQKPAHQGADENNGKIVGQISKDEPKRMPPRMKIEGFDTIRKKTNRELHPVDAHHDEETNEEGKGGPAGRDGFGKPIREFGQRKFHLYFNHGGLFVCRFLSTYAGTTRSARG